MAQDKQLPDIEKLNAKFDKKFGGKEIVIQVIERTGYFQDFKTVVESFSGSLAFIGDAYKEEQRIGDIILNTKYQTFVRNYEFEITNDDSGEVKIAKGIMRASLRGNRLVPGGLNTKNGEEIFANINEDTYWPNGYNVGKYNEGGHDYYLYSFLKED